MKALTESQTNLIRNMIKMFEEYLNEGYIAKGDDNCRTAIIDLKYVLFKRAYDVSEATVLRRYRKRYLKYKNYV
jgi:hypothetical protein